MKKFFVIFFALTLLFSVQPVSAATGASVYRGQILMDSDFGDALWYIHPKNLTRYALTSGDELFSLIQSQAVGVKHEVMKKIPDAKISAGDAALVTRLKGSFILDTENHGEVYYVNPRDGRKYYIKDKATGLDTLRGLAKSVTTKEVKKITMNTQQTVFDYTFNQVAYVKFGAATFTGGAYANQVLPIASLTKLMTALVILDLKPDWDKRITLKKTDIDFPRQFVGEGDVTSEINLQAGDTISFKDLWGAMLLASSNQAAGVLSENVGITRTEFVKKMNEKARQLKLTKTRFTDPTGLGVTNLSTAKEMSIIADAAFRQSKIADVTLASFTFLATQPDGINRDVSVVNRNYSLMAFGADAAKTGFLYEAQRTVVLKKDNKIITVLHARSMSERNSIIKQLLAE